MASACVYMECPITGMILAVSRKDNPTAFGLPGGKVEDGQTEESCAIAELEQETGAQLYRAMGFEEIFRREGGVTFRVHFSDLYKIVPKAPGETGVVAWVFPKQLIEGPFGDYNRRLLEHIGKIPPMTNEEKENRIKALSQQLHGSLDNVGLSDSILLGLTLGHGEIQLAQAAVHRTLGVRRIRTVLQRAVAQTQERLVLGIMNHIRKLVHEGFVDDHFLR